MKHNWLSIFWVKCHIGILLLCLALASATLGVEGATQLKTVAVGITNAAGEFTVTLPWLGTTVSGKLVGPDNQPLASHLFTINLLSKNANIVSAKDISKFTVSVPDYVKTTVTKFSVSSVFELTNFLLGDVQLLPARLQWSEDRPLTWDDFQGEPLENKGSRMPAAVIALQLRYFYRLSSSFDERSGKWTTHLISVGAINTMDRSRSWVLLNWKTPKTLNHEQKHFDLNEVYRRLLDAELQKLVYKLETTGDTKEEAEEKLIRELERVRLRFSKKCCEMHRQYDQETSYGQNVKKQAEWDKKISEWLKDPSKAPQP